MFISTITGEKLSIKCDTQDQKIIKDELNKKYGYDIDKLKLHWNGKIFILGFFNDREECDLSPKENNVENNPYNDENLDFYKEKLLNDSKLTSEDKTIICKNLKVICKTALDSLEIDLSKGI